MSRKLITSKEALYRFGYRTKNARNNLPRVLLREKLTLVKQGNRNFLFEDEVDEKIAAKRDRT